VSGLLFLEKLAPCLTPSLQLGRIRMACLASGSLSWLMGMTWRFFDSEIPLPLAPPQKSACVASAQLALSRTIAHGEPLPLLTYENRRICTGGLFS